MTTEAATASVVPSSGANSMSTPTFEEIAEDQRLGSMAEKSKERADADWMALGRHRWHMCADPNGPRYTLAVYAKAVGVTRSSVGKSVRAWADGLAAANVALVSHGTQERRQGKGRASSPVVEAVSVAIKAGQKLDDPTPEQYREARNKQRGPGPVYVEALEYARNNEIDYQGLLDMYQPRGLTSTQARRITNWADKDRSDDRRRDEPEQGEPKKKRAENFDGKTNPMRERELRKKKKEGNYADLIRAQLRINQLCSALEITSDMVDTFDMEATTVPVIADIQDDLITLGVWVDRALQRINAWFTDGDVREKIKKLRNTNGRTPEEVEAFSRAADRLERALEARLQPGPLLRLMEG